jgi:hypothetical protein
MDRKLVTYVTYLAVGAGLPRVGRADARAQWCWARCTWGTCRSLSRIRGRHQAAAPIAAAAPAVP